MLSFQDKVVVITGGAQGIGECIADTFLSQGAIICVIDTHAIEQTKKYHYTYQGDIADQHTLKAFSQNVIETFGHIDYLINNACVMKGGLFNASYEEFLYVQHVGVIAPFMLSQHFEPHFRRHGAIINIASTRAFQSQANTECYSAAKGGIVALTHALAHSLRGKVRVNCISPGWIDTTKGASLTQNDHDQHLVGRVGVPSDIADMVCFLCSQHASFITGENIIVDGGMSKTMIYHNDEGWHYDAEKRHTPSHD